MKYKYFLSEPASEDHINVKKELATHNEKE